MTVDKEEIKELQKAVEKKLEELRLEPKPNNSKIFELTNLDSNISLFLLSAEFKDDPPELRPKEDRLIINALKEFRTEHPDKADADAFNKDVLSSVVEILALINQTLEDLSHAPGEEVFANNIRLRLEAAQNALNQITDLPNASKKTQKDWHTKEVPMPLSDAGKMLGSARSAKKAASSRLNGLKGGRPRKSAAEGKTTAPKKKAPAKTAAKQPAKKTAAVKKTAAKSSSAAATKKKSAVSAKKTAAAASRAPRTAAAKKTAAKKTGRKSKA